MTLLHVEGLTKSFAGPRRGLGRMIGVGRRASRVVVDDVGFDVAAGETLAVVGESGAGKSTTGRLVLRLIEPDAGSVDFAGMDVRAASGRKLRLLRRRMQVVFQDPHASFDPRRPLGASLVEPMAFHGLGTDGSRAHRAADLMERVGLGPHLLQRFPGELSGGQLQRAAIARVLTLEPELIVCDEAVSALDVSMRAQVVNLLEDLQLELGVSYLFIAHDLALVEVMAHRVAVMKDGRIVEIGPTAQLFDAPSTPYTRELLAAIPGREAPDEPGSPPDPTAQPARLIAD